MDRQNVGCKAAQKLFVRSLLLVWYRASGSAFVLHLLGAKDVALFDGSWEAWAAADLPREIDA